MLRTSSSDMHERESDCTLSQFVERDLVLNKSADMIARLHKGMKDPSTIIWSGRDEREEETLFEMIDKYQEQPQLLDSSLNDIVKPILDAILTHTLKSTVDYTTLVKASASIFRFLQRIFKTRNPKVSCKVLTHEVAHLEPMLLFLEFTCYEHPTDRFWETRYVLFLWTAMICRTPFDLSTIDSSNSGSELTLVQRLLRVSGDFIGSVGKEYEGACQLTMRLLTRQDLVHVQLVPFVEKTIESLLSCQDDKDPLVLFKIRGELMVLCMLYKFAPRQQLLAVCNSSRIHEIMENEIVHGNSLLRKLACKLSQRVSLCYVPPKKVTWRYQKVSRRLFQAFESNLTQIESDSSEQIQATDESGIEVPEIVEESLQQLLSSLRDKDTIVRWTCAKGIARLSNRLALELVDEIITSLVDMFKEDVDDYAESPLHADVMGASDSTWHGCCLALAEMSRRGLLLPYHLSNVIPWISRALFFDQKKGAHSVGSAVRDSAAYVCWSFARAYDADVLVSYALNLSHVLIVAALTDREVNVRRACAAAFQEHVGRHGLFQHGIDVITQADYFALGNRANVFLDVLPSIARYQEYTQVLLSHLSNVTLYHWDLEMRELGANSIGTVLRSQSFEVAISVLDHIVDDASSSDLIVRTGALFGIASVIRCLTESFASCKSTLDSSCFSHVLEKLSSLFSNKNSSVLDSFGSEITRTACCRLITSICDAPWISSVSNVSSFLGVVWSFLQTTISRPEDALQEEASKTISSLLTISELDTGSRLDWLFDSTQATRDKFLRRGASLAIGRLSQSLVKQHTSEVLKALAQASTVLSNNLLNDAETRRNAINSMISVMNSYGTDILFHPDRNLIFQAYIDGLEDYSVDSRGDVGSWIREASVNASKQLFVMISGANVSPDKVLPLSTRTSLIAHMARQAMDKIDRLRVMAGKTLTELVCQQEVPFEYQDVLRPLFRKKIDWMDVSCVFPVMMEFLRLPPYREQVILGVIFCFSCLIENTVQSMTFSFLDFVKSLDGDGQGSVTRNDLLTTTLHIFKSNMKKDRVTVPLLEFLEKCFFMGVFSDACDADLLRQLLSCVKTEVVRTKSMKKLNPAVNIFHAYGCFNNLSDHPLLTQAKQESTEQLIRFLSHPYPIIRRSVSELLYLILSIETSLDPYAVAKAEETLLSKAWETTPQAELKELVGKMLSVVQPNT